MWYSIVTDEAKFKQLIDAISDLKKEVREEITSCLSKLHKGVLDKQESASMEVTKMIGKRSHPFQKKGNEAQFNFNTEVEEQMEAAKEELAKIPPSDLVSARGMNCIERSTKSTLKWQTTSSLDGLLSPFMRVMSSLTTRMMRKDYLRQKKVKRIQDKKKRASAGKKVCTN